MVSLKNLASKKRGRDAVGQLSLGMSSSKAIQYLKDETSEIESYTMQSMSVKTLLDLFIQGLLHFEPNGQRGLVIDSDYCKAIAMTLLDTHIGLPNIILNLCDNVYYVYDGKQRVLAILTLAMGLLQDEYPLCPLNSAYWHERVYAETTNDHIEHMLDILYERMGKKGSNRPVDQDVSSRFLALEFDAHVYPHWPAKSLAVASTLFLVKRISHTPHEVLYQIDCYICDLLREYEPSFCISLAMITKTKIYNEHKNVFADMLRGVGCCIVSYVPKGTNFYGYGKFMDELVPFVSKQPDEEIVKNIQRAFTVKLKGFVDYMKSINMKMNRFSPDMIAIFVYLLYLKVNPEEINAVLLRLQKPRMEGTAFAYWYKTFYRKYENMQESLQELGNEEIDVSS